MKRVKKSSKFGSYYLRRYKYAKATSVEQFYKRPSSAKILAEKKCLWIMEQEHGKGYKILGGNTQKFTAAWRTTEGLRVETAENSYLIF